MAERSSSLWCISAPEMATTVAANETSSAATSTPPRPSVVTSAVGATLAAPPATRFDRRVLLDAFETTDDISKDLLDTALNRPSTRPPATPGSKRPAQRSFDLARFRPAGVHTLAAPSNCPSSGSPPRHRHRGRRRSGRLSFRRVRIRASAMPVATRLWTKTGRGW